MSIETIEKIDDHFKHNFPHGLKMNYETWTKLRNHIRSLESQVEEALHENKMYTRANQLLHEQVEQLEERVKELTERSREYEMRLYPNRYYKPEGVKP